MIPQGVDNFLNIPANDYRKQLIQNPSVEGYKILNKENSTNYKLVTLIVITYKKASLLHEKVWKDTKICRKKRVLVAGTFDQPQASKRRFFLPHSKH